jgi:hypothetical protein
MNRKMPMQIRLMTTTGAMTAATMVPVVECGFGVGAGVLDAVGVRRTVVTNGEARWDVGLEVDDEGRDGVPVVEVVGG